jgi:hypothetical protein
MSKKDWATVFSQSLQCGYIYIYIEREREREEGVGQGVHVRLSRDMVSEL